MIYFAQDSGSGHVKIGRAANPWLRLTKMQSDCPGAVAILALEEGDADREAELHARFSEHRLRGEWFAPAEDLMAHVAALGAPTRPIPNSASRAFWGGMSDAEISRASGIAKSTLSQIRSGKCGASVKVALEIERLSEGRIAADSLNPDVGLVRSAEARPAA